MFLVFPVATLYLTIVARCIGTDKFVSDGQMGYSSFKQSGDDPLAVGKALCKLKSTVWAHSTWIPR